MPDFYGPDPCLLTDVVSHDIDHIERSKTIWLVNKEDLAFLKVEIHKIFRKGRNK
jgi:hypothetical protein